MVIRCFFRSSYLGMSHLLVHHLLQEALVVHVSAALVEKTVASHDALARYELEKVVASHQAHAR